MAFENYTDMSNELASVTSDKNLPMFTDVVNYKKEFIKGTLESVGGMTVASRGVQAVKTLRTAIKGTNVEKYGFSDQDLGEIQDSLENSDFTGALSKLTTKLTGKITDAGKAALNEVKSKIMNLKQLSPESVTQTATKTVSEGVEETSIDEAAQSVPKVAATVGADVEKAAEVGSKIETATTDATEAISALGKGSVALDFDPVTFFVGVGMGLGSLVAGLELRAHKEKWQTSKEIVKSYSEQADV